MFKKIVLLLVLLSCFTSSLYANKKEIKSSVTLFVLHSWYNDIKITDSPAVELTPSIDLEAAIRLYKIFNLSLFLTAAPDNSLQGAGFGFRIGLPGFFFLGGRYWDMFRKGKNYPLNTSFYMNSQYNLVKDNTGNTNKALSSKFGLTTEIFFMGEGITLVLDGSLYTLQGNTFLSYSAGFSFPF